MKRVTTAVVGCGMISNIYIKNLKNMFSIIDLAAGAHGELPEHPGCGYGGGSGAAEI